MNRSLRRSEFLVLNCLYNAIKDITSRDIAAVTGLNIRTVGNALKLFREKGWVTRRKYLHDLNLWYQRITDVGRLEYELIFDGGEKRWSQRQSHMIQESRRTS